MARPSKYQTHVEPYFGEIKEALEKGVDEKEIAKNLGVSISSWCEYKHKFPAFSELFKNIDRTELIKSLESALIKRAQGYEYEEKRQYIKRDENDEEVTYTEIMTKYQAPDTTAIFGALNRFDKNYVKDRAYYNLKKQELELRKAIARSDHFDLDLKEGE